MTNEQLLKNVSRLGFPLMEPLRDLDVNKTLAAVVNGDNVRLWEGFPVLLANAVKQENFSYTQLRQLVQEGKQDALKKLVLLSCALYKHNHLEFDWADRLLKRFFTKKDMKEFNRYNEYFKRGNESFALHSSKLMTQRMQELFLNYFEQEAVRAKEMRSKHEELSLEYALSQVFSRKQKELFKKKLGGEPLTKTEREYYSRTVKKKVSALANPELNRLAQKLLEF